MPNTKIIVICNNKGGVGKTTCTAGIADVLARKLKKSVLLIDADPQGNLSKRFGYSPNMRIDNSFDVLLQNELDIKSGDRDVHVPTSFFYNIGRKFSPKTTTRKDYDNLKIMCSNKTLENVYSNFRAKPQYAEGILRKILSSIRQSNEFDYVLIDTQPTLSYMLGQYLLGADYIMVPVTPNDDAFDGADAIGKVFNDAQEAKSQFKTDDTIDFLGIFFNMVKRNTKSAKKFRKDLADIWGDNPIFENSIPLNQDANNAENDRAPVTCAYPSSTSAAALEKLTEEMVKRIEE
jgi:chromosome partitioning protein